ncbi:hypothetical protein, partial [Escherichia coli]|uniref:hypothetical protein n=1 Tax=Escherichia coli TaxID=562 RepID=UPI000D4D6DCD
VIAVYDEYVGFFMYNDYTATLSRKRLIEIKFCTDQFAFHVTIETFLCLRHFFIAYVITNVPYIKRRTKWNLK